MGSQPIPSGKTRAYVIGDIHGRSQRINVDTGAFATGRLTCVVLGGSEPRFLATA